MMGSWGGGVHHIHHIHHPSPFTKDKPTPMKRSGRGFGPRLVTIRDDLSSAGNHGDVL